MKKPLQYHLNPPPLKTIASLTHTKPTQIHSTTITILDNPNKKLGFIIGCDEVTCLKHSLNDQNERKGVFHIHFIL